MKIVFLHIVFWVVAAFCCACSSSADRPELFDGYYTAETAEFDANGWKPYLTLYVSNGRIVTVEFNSKSSSGFARSWDVRCMRGEAMAQDQHYRMAIREYAAALVDKQQPAAVGPLQVCVKTHKPFQALAEAAVSQAKSGIKDVAVVALQ